MTLRTRLVASFGYVLLLVLVVLAVPLALNVRERVETQARARGAEAAYLVAAGASGRLDQAGVLDGLAREAAARVGGRVIVVDRGGLLVADSAGSALRGDAYGARPEIRLALDEGRSTQGERRSDTLGRDILVTAVPIVASGSRVGAVRVSQDVAAIDHRVRLDLAQVAALALVALVVGLALIWFVAGAIARPTRRLAGTAARLAGGDLDARAERGGAREQRELAEAFDTMAERLGAAIESQRAFASHASHQLRTPLTGLLLRIEGARALTREADVDRELGRAEDEVGRLARLVDALLALARDDADAPPPARPADLRAEAERAVERFAGQAARDGRSLHLSAPAGAVMVPLSSEDAAIVLDNLVENALRYGLGAAAITVVLELDAASVRLHVEDGGAGIALEEAEAVFARFARGRAARGTSGSGLGLALVRTLARRAGGDAVVVAGVVEVRLPLAATMRAQAGDSPEVPLTRAEPSPP